MRLRKATKDDIDLLFLWANDAVVRANSFSSEPILFEHHKEWFDEQLHDMNTMIYIYLFNEQPVGQVRINISGKVATVGYSIDEKYRMQGHGKTMLRLLEGQLKEDYPFVEKIRAEVKGENAASIHAFRAVGYDDKCLVFEKRISANY